MESVTLAVTPVFFNIMTMKIKTVPKGTNVYFPPYHIWKYFGGSRLYLCSSLNKKVWKRNYLQLYHNTKCILAMHAFKTFSHLLWFDMNFFSCNSKNSFPCLSTLNSSNVKCAQYCTIQIPSSKLKKWQFLHVEFCPTLGGRWKCKRAALHAENISAVYEQLFKDLSGLKEWIDIFVQRGLLESKWSLLSLLLPKNFNVSNCTHLNLHVLHESG